MSIYTINFMPDGRKVEVEASTILIEAAKKAGVYVNSLCGGQGVCGKCKVQVTKGKFKPDKNSIAFFSKEEIKKGYVLACQTEVIDNLEVFIPPESRIESEQILMDESVVDYSKPEAVSVARVASDPLSFFEPLVQKIYLALPAPTSEDNIADIDRVIREIRKKLNYHSFEISLHCLRGLAEKLRNNDWKITATIVKHGDIWRISQIEPGDTSSDNYGIAVDVGTTTIVAQLIHLKTGRVIGVEASHNLQAHYGEDVISRIVFSCGREKGLNPLHEAVVENINSLIKNLCEKKGVNIGDINSIVAAGNTTMSHLLLGLVPCSIRLDPYVPTAHIFPQILAGDIDIHGNPEAVLETIADVASYVGGDIVAGVLATGIADKPETKILIDVGTNGEIAMGNNDWLVCCSASAGPAFEGGGINYGMRATLGAIERIEIDNGEVKYKSIGKAKPRGICGSGLIDCLYELVRNKIIDQQGNFNLSLKSERLIEIDDEPAYIIAFSNETENGENITINESEISNLIRSKGAVFAAIKSLVDYIGMGFDAIDTFFVAGGFGNYLNIPKAIAIGLLPDIDPSKIKFVGNSSLMGARMALLSSHAFDRTIEIAKMMTNIELSTYLPFMDEYVASLFLPHTERRLFPSVDYWPEQSG